MLGILATALRFSFDAEMATLTEPSNGSFHNHVSFDNLPSGEATKNNTLSLVLNVRHNGYQKSRRSRTFMVGVDEHPYSDYAISWLLDELVDDGDEVVCVRVIEKDIRFSDRQYRLDAQQILDGIVAKSGAKRAISIVLEYSVGKLHATFQKLVRLASPPPPPRCGPADDWPVPPDAHVPARRAHCRN